MTGRTAEDYVLDEEGFPKSVGESPTIIFSSNVPNDISERKKNSLLLGLYVTRASSAFFMTTVAGVSCFLASQYWLESEGHTYRMTNVDVPLSILVASFLYRCSMIFKDRFGVESCSFVVSLLVACAYVPFYVSLFTFPFHPVVYWLIRTALWTCFFQHLFSFVQILEHRGLVHRRFDATLLVPVLWWPVVFGCLAAVLIYYTTHNSDAHADLIDHEIQRLKNMTTCVFGLLMAYWTTLSIAQLLQQKAEKLGLLRRLGGRVGGGPGKLILQDAMHDDSSETRSSTDDRGLRHLMVSDRDSTAIPVEPGDDLSGAMHSVPKDTGDLPDFFAEDPRPTIRGVARDHWIFTLRTFSDGQHRATLAVCLLLMSSIFQVSRRSIPDMRSFFFQVPVLIFVVLTLVGSALSACTMRLPLAPERRRTLSYVAWSVSAAFVSVAMCLELTLDWESFDSTDPSPGAIASRDVFLGAIGFVLGLCFGFVVIECSDTDDTRDRADDDAFFPVEVVALCEIPFSLCVIAFSLGTFLQETVIRLACRDETSWVPGSDSGESPQGDGECYYTYLPWCAAVACFLCVFFIWIPRIARFCVRR